MATLGKRRAYGQHFLKDRAIARQIAEAAVNEASERGCRSLLEIGPGKGALTEPILTLLHVPQVAQPDTLVLCERDVALAGHWSRRAGEVAPPPAIRVHAGDFLELPEEKWLGEAPVAVASNLPYSAGTAILARLARHWDRIPVMVLMFQAEVARRLRAEPRTRERGSLSVWIQNRWDVRKLRAVPPRAFAPPPEVDSEVVVLTRRSEPWIAVEPDAEPRFESLLKAAFAHRRKMLRKALSAAPGRWRNALDASGVDGTKRAEELGWEDWKKLWEAASGAS